MPRLHPAGHVAQLARIQNVSRTSNLYSDTYRPRPMSTDTCRRIQVARPGHLYRRRQVNTSGYNLYPATYPGVNAALGYFTLFSISHFNAFILLTSCAAQNSNSWFAILKCSHLDKQTPYFPSALTLYYANHRPKLCEWPCVTNATWYFGDARK